ncbi:hypothetical protein CsSME_00013978 [Camellia sinensis var. sinensis]
MCSGNNFADLCLLMWLALFLPCVLMSLVLIATWGFGSAGFQRLRYVLGPKWWALIFMGLPMSVVPHSRVQL